MALMIEVVKAEGGAYGVKLAGQLDTATAEELDRKMEEGVWKDAGARAVRLDLSGLVFISSKGLGSVAKIKRKATERGGAMVMVGLTPQVAKVFEIVKMLPKETVFTTVAEADAYLMAVQKKVMRGE